MPLLNNMIYEKDEIKRILNLFPEVLWDRYIEDRGGTTEDDYSDVRTDYFYGWITREDQYKDFMILSMQEDGWSYLTSSSKYSAEFHKRMETKAEHTDCDRVEDLFPLEVNVVRLK